MKKLLIIADGITTVHPTRMEQLINQIDMSRFEVHFATTENYLPILALSSNPKVQMHSITSVPTKTFVERVYNAQFPWTRSDLESQYNEDLELIRKIKPEIVIGDTRHTLAPACKKEKVLYYNVVNFHWTPLYERPMLVPYTKQVIQLGRKTASSISKWLTPLFELKQKVSINSWLSSVGYPKVKSIYEFYCQGDILLFPDVGENFQNCAIPENGFFIGPLLWENKKTEWPADWKEFDPKKKYALVTMGSSGETKHIPSVLKALNFLGYVVVYIGPKSVLKNPEQFQMMTAEFVPMERVLNHCSLAISNGGNGTSYQFLMKGVLSYYLPTNMDQYLNAIKLRDLGLSDFQDIDQFSEKVFIEKIMKLVNSEGVKGRYKVAQSSIKEELNNDFLNLVLNK